MNSMMQAEESQILDLASVRYTMEGASFLLKVPPTTLRRWANGYTTKTKYGQEIHKRGLLQSNREEPALFNFLELIELRFARDLLRLPAGDDPEINIKLKEKGKIESKRLSDIVNIAENLYDALGSYPLARANFHTVGRQLVTNQIAGENLFFNAQTLQILLDFADEIARKVEFEYDDVTRLTTRWYPDPDNRHVLIDPKVKFGRPAVARTSTEAIYSRYELEDCCVEDTAEWFNLTVEEIIAAVDFEEKWKAA